MIARERLRTRTPVFTLHHHSVGSVLAPPIIDTASYISHDASIRTSSLLLDARAPNQTDGLACADHSHPGLPSIRAISGYGVLLRSIQ